MFYPKRVSDDVCAVMQVPDEDVCADEVEALVAEADAYSLASHLLWAMWALLQSKVRAVLLSRGRTRRFNTGFHPSPVLNPTLSRCSLDVVAYLFPTVARPVGLK